MVLGPFIDDTRYADSVADRIGRSDSGRAAAAAGIRRVASAGRTPARERTAGPDAAGDGTGPRGIYPSGAIGIHSTLGWSGSLLCCRGGSNAAYLGRERSAKGA